MTNQKSACFAGVSRTSHPRLVARYVSNWHAVNSVTVRSRLLTESLSCDDPLAGLRGGARHGLSMDAAGCSDQVERQKARLPGSTAQSPAVPFPGPGFLRLDEPFSCLRLGP